MCAVLSNDLLASVYSRGCSLRRDHGTRPQGAAAEAGPPSSKSARGLGQLGDAKPSCRSGSVPSRVARHASCSLVTTSCLRELPGVTSPLLPVIAASGATREAPSPLPFLCQRAKDKRVTAGRGVTASPAGGSCLFLSLVPLSPFGF